MRKLFLFLLFALCGFSAEARRVGVFSFFADDGKQIYEDENVRVVIAVNDNEPYLAVVNKTDHVIYIDKGSSFVYKNGQATCLFSNSSYSSGTGSAGGASVNLGGVASALGVGGAVGTILGGVNVGGGRSSQSSTTYYEQRVMALAPKAAYTLYTWANPSSYVSLPNPKPRKKGRTWSFERHNTPYVIEALLRYSADESFSSVQEVTVSDYISDVVYDKASYAKRGYLYVGPYCRLFSGRNGVCTWRGPANGLWVGVGALSLMWISSIIVSDM